MYSEVVTKLPFSLTVRESVLRKSTLDVQWGNGTITIKAAGENAAGSADSVINISTADLQQRVTILPTGDIVDFNTDVSGRARDLSMVVASAKVTDRLFVRFPAHDVSPNQSWTVLISDTSVSDYGMGSVITSGTVVYTYRGIADTLGKKCWKIDISSKGITQTGRLTGASMEFTLHGTGTLTGYTLQDQKTGLVVISTSDFETNVTMNTRSAQDPSQDVSVPIRSIVRVHVERMEGK